MGNENANEVQSIIPKALEGEIARLDQRFKVKYILYLIVKYNKMISIFCHHNITFSIKIFAFLFSRCL